MMSQLLALLRPTPTEKLPTIRPASEILSDIDHQVGRLASMRDRAVELIRKVEDEPAE